MEHLKDYHLLNSEDSFAVLSADELLGEIDLSAAPQAAPEASPLLWEEPAGEEGAEAEPPAFAVGDIVASTVDSVLAERKDDQRRYRRQHRREQKRKERIHRSKAERATDADQFDQEEPSLTEATILQKRALRRTREKAVIATALAALYWVPVILAAFGVAIPYYSGDIRIRMAALAAVQLAVCIAGWQVFDKGIRALMRGRVSCHLMAALSNVVTLLDTATLYFLPGRTEAVPLGGLSVIALALTLWGDCWYAGALREGFRLVALGRPAYVVDLTVSGARKKSGSAAGFYNRTVREKEALGWQNLLLPVILVASVVFAVLSSFGKDNSADFLWCWSAVLTAGTALALPFAYSLPYCRLAKRLGKSGCAVAGFYGAKQISYSREILVEDGDLFPAGTMKMAGMKIIAEDRRKVAAYAGSLARAYGGTWRELFEPFMQAEGARQQKLEHFHVHGEGGVSASIHGETAILGVANLIRKMSVRLPRSLEWKDGLFLAVDGELIAIFGVVYEPADSVSWALGAMRRNGLVPLLATRDPNLHPRFLKKYFGQDGGSHLLDLNERLTLTADREDVQLRPNALLYREGLAPFLETVAGSKRLCRAVNAANGITLLGCVVGTLLAFYLTFVDRAAMLTPTQLLLFLTLWTVPVFLLSWNVDRL